MTKLAPEWVRTSDPVIRSPARYRWTTAPASKDIEYLLAAQYVVEEKQVCDDSSISLRQVLRTGIESWQTDSWKKK